MLIIALVFNANILFCLFVCFIQFFRRIRTENGVFFTRAGDGKAGRHIPIPLLAPT